MTQELSWEDPGAFLLDGAAPQKTTPAWDMPDNRENLLPPYLRALPPQEGAHFYGTLSYNRKSQCWVISGEPSVTEMCKRLFPASSGSRRGEARFTAHRRSVEDILWLMLRFPLEVRMRDLSLWTEAVEKTRTHAEKVYIREKNLRHTAPDAAVFAGTLMDFQKEGFQYLLLHDRCLLADEMGLGKTVQALACLAEEKRFPVLIVAPPHLVRNWENEIARFLRLDGKPARVHVLHGLSPYRLPEADIYLMHYLLLRGWKQTLPTLGFQSVVFDEIQELRHAGTEKYSAASLLSDACERVIGLSGTPVYNEGSEIWNVINILDFHFLGSWESFTREWCTGYGNRMVRKPEILGDYLRREGLMLRRTKQDVLSELPPKRRLVQTLDLNDQLYARLMAPVIAELTQWKQSSNLTAAQRQILENSISLHARQATGIAKAPYVCQFVRVLLESGERVLLFAHHHAVFDRYRNELKGFHPLFLTGRETLEEKARNAEAIMQWESTLLCLSLRAASGLNLQKATCVVFGELDWSPAVHTQAEDRAHRIGQRDSLLCYYLVSPSGSDAFMQEALGLKVSQFIGLMGDTPLSPQQQMQDASMARQHVEKLMQEFMPSDAEKEAGH